MVTWSEVERFGLSDLTDAEIASTLSGITNRPLPIVGLRLWMRTTMVPGPSGSRPIWHRSRTYEVSGLLEDLIADPTLDQDIGTKLTAFLDHVGDDSHSDVETNKRPHARIVIALVSMLVLNGFVSPDVASGFWGLAGGRLFGDVSADDVAVARAEAIRMETVAELTSWFTTVVFNTVCERVQSGELTSIQEIKAALAQLAGA